MKKSQIFTITACSVAAVLLSGVLVAGLSDGGFHLGAADPAAKTHQHQVDVDLEEASVSALDIYWVDGKVEVTQSPDNQIHVIERSEAALEEADQMDVAVSGGTLSVKWDGQWFNKFSKWISFGWLQRGSKDLTVQLPASVTAEMDLLKIATTSGDIAVDAACHAETARFSTTSGKVAVSDLTVAEGLSLSSVSGNISLAEIQCETLAVSTTSGKLQLNRTMAQEAEISSTSGDCLYTGQVDTLRMDTVSGAMEAELSACPVESHMGAVSGRLTLSIPENPGFTVEYSTVSGKLDSDFPLSQLGKQGHMNYGSGAGLLHFNTTSGNMRIRKA